MFRSPVVVRIDCLQRSGLRIGPLLTHRCVPPTQRKAESESVLMVLGPSNKRAEDPTRTVVTTLYPTKVFGVGFHKTGTTSLRDALRILGYRVTGPNFTQEQRLEHLLLRAAELAEQYDGFQDDPWPLLFREMDQRFPDSKFVLTVRDPDEWYMSVLRHFGDKNSSMRKFIYGIGHPKDNEHIYKTRVEAHNREVMDYFASRPEDLLVMDLTNGDGWDKLCPFLGHPAPQSPFPHANLGMPSWLRRSRRRLRLLRRQLRLAAEALLGRSLTTKG